MIELLIKYIGMILVIFLLTSLYGKRSPFYSLASSLLLAVAIAYLVVYCSTAIYEIAIRIPQGEPLYIIPLMLGLLLFARFFPRYSAIARLPIAFSVGTFLGLSFRTIIFTDVIGFGKSAILPLFAPGDALQTFFNITTVLFTTTILLFFIYTFPATQKGPVRKIGKLGELFLYGALGGIGANSFLGNINSIASSLGVYLKPMSDAAIFIILGIITLVIVIALDKQGLLEKYSA